MNITSTVSGAFQGFSEPKENYYRLPNNWFDFWISFRAEVGDRIAAPLKVQEYVLLHTWGASRFDGRVRLSASEIHSGRKARKNARRDTGVGVSENAVRKAAETLAQFGALNVSQNKKDQARKMRTYQPNLLSEEPQPEEDLLRVGFTKPTENYFKVPKSWIAVIREIGSAAVILTVEYLIRHSWGYHNAKGVWVTAEEVANGRKYSDGKRYDNGTGFALATVQRALKQASELGLVAWQDYFEAGIIIRKYNLRFEGMKTDPSGMFLEDPDDANEEVCDANEVVDDANEGLFANTNEVADDAIEDACDANEEVDDANEARSLKDTLLNTHSRHALETPTTTHRAGQSEHRPGQDEHSPVVGAESKRKAAQKDPGQLPADVTEALCAIGWADKTTEVQVFFEKNPALVKAWAHYAQKISEHEIKKTRAALFRHGIRTGLMPPELPDYSDYLDDQDDSEIPEEPVSLLPVLSDPAQKVWQTVLGQLQSEMPRASYDAWVRETKPISLDGAMLVIGAKNTYARDWLDSRLSSKVSRLLIGILNTADPGVEFVVAEAAR